MENDLGPPVEDAMMTSEKRIEIGTTWPSYHSPGPITYAWKIICKAELSCQSAHFSITIFLIFIPR